MTDTTIQFLWGDRRISSEFRSGVSLHSHTMYSEESLEMIPRYTRKVPWLGGAVAAETDRYRERNQQELDFSLAFWTPPLSPREAHRLEEKQIQKTFQLPGFVSLTDHDDIRSGTQLQVLDNFRHTPISTEWTIPFGPTFFHMGVHNLPAASAPAIMEHLKAHTKAPGEHSLDGILKDLNAMPDVLLVLNHPLWDEKGIGVPEHAQVLGRLLERHGRSIHGLEVNGLRSWKENQQVIWLARQSNLPVLSGGDRHGLEPNAIVNLSRGTNLVEFIHEVRNERRSHVVFMPQYREPMKYRILQTMVDIVRDYPDNLEGRRSWADRVFYRPAGAIAPIPIRQYWPEDREPFVIRTFLRFIRVIQFRGVRSALRLALNDSAIWSDQEAAI